MESMFLEPHLEMALRNRIERHASLEVLGDAAALYEFIDPDVRKSREERYDFEPELTISKIHEYVRNIDSASVVSVAIDAFTEDGGPSRGHRPTAIVSSAIRYNAHEAATEYRTPWVLVAGQWYTRAVGKIHWPSDV